MRFFCCLLLLLPSLALGEPLRVFVSVLPMKTFVEKVGGEHVEVRAMVQPGHSPAVYDPTPQQIAELARTRLYVAIGVPFEHAWMKRIRGANPSMQILDVQGDLPMRRLDEHHHEDPAHAHHHRHEAESGLLEDEPDPHVWTSPPLVVRMAGSIRDRLTELDPAHAEAFARNHDEFVRELEDLDRDIRTLLAPVQNRRFLVFHPSWGYFADAYGLVQVPIEREGKQPGAKALAGLIDQAKRERIRVVFVQPQFDRRQAELVADAIGGGVIAVDPLATDYAANLRRVAQHFAEALRP